MNNAPNLRKHRYSCSNHAYCVTICTENREPYFVDFALARLVINAMKYQDLNHHTSTLAFVIMPDHLHWLFILNNTQLGTVIQRVKSYCAHQFGRQLWQKGYYEQHLRNDKDLVALSRYIVANPLRANLVSSIGEYPFWDALWLRN